MLGQIKNDENKQIIQYSNKKLVVSEKKLMWTRKAVKMERHV